MRYILPFLFPILPTPSIPSIIIPCHLTIFHLPSLDTQALNQTDRNKLISTFSEFPPLTFSSSPLVRRVMVCPLLSFLETCLCRRWR